jgi:hypothetical protein
MILISYLLVVEFYLPSLRIRRSLGRRSEEEFCQQLDLDRYEKTGGHVDIEVCLD